MERISLDSILQSVLGDPEAIFLLTETPHGFNRVILPSMLLHRLLSGIESKECHFNYFTTYRVSIGTFISMLKNPLPHLSRIPLWHKAQEGICGLSDARIRDQCCLSKCFIKMSITSCTYFTLIKGLNLNSSATVEGMVGSPLLTFSYGFNKKQIIHFLDYIKDHHGHVFTHKMSNAAVFLNIISG